MTCFYVCSQISYEACITSKIAIQLETMRAKSCYAGEETGNGKSDRSPSAMWGHLTGCDQDLAMLTQYELKTASGVQKTLAGET
jgi:hypothetical protein